MFFKLKSPVYGDFKTSFWVDNYLHECNFKLINGFYSVHMNWLLLKYQITLI